MSRGVVIAMLGILAACSRHERPRPSAQTAKESSSTTTRSGTVDVPPATPTPVAVAPSVPAAALITPVAVRSLAGKKVLHVGDSMVGGNWGLTRAFESKLTREGAKIVRHTKVSESLTSFDKGPTLRDLLHTHDPDIVVITLGSNDALVPHPEVFAKSIQNIVKRVGDRECWWLGPPMWQRDTGIIAVIQENAGSCRFFDSSTLNLERASDGIHPSDRGGAKWADAFWQVFREPSALP
jgi:hypothetical protein